MNSYIIADKMRFFALLIVGLGVLIALGIFMNNYLLRSKAAQGSVTINVSARSGEYIVGDVFFVTVRVAANNNLKISGMDLSILDEKNAFHFLGYTGSVPPASVSEGFFTTSTLPNGFDDMVTQKTPSRSDGTRRIERLVFTAKRTASQLVGVTNVYLGFKVAKEIDNSASIIIQVPGSVFSGPGIDLGLFSVDKASSVLSAGAGAPICTEIQPPDSLTCSSTCGTGFTFEWADRANGEQGYRLYRDSESQPALADLPANTNRTTLNWCNDFRTHTFSIASTKRGCREARASVQCACSACERKPTATPIPVRIDPNTSTLRLRLNFPDVAQTVESLQNVRVEVMNGEVLACPDCSKSVPFTRNGNYFESIPLDFLLSKTIPYTVVVKHPLSVRRIYRFVFLSKGKVVDCTQGVESACGQLLSEINTRPMYMGDLDGFNAGAPSFNKINEVDLEKVNTQLGTNSTEADVNMDGVVDAGDTAVLGKNFGKNGD